MRGEPGVPYGKQHGTADQLDGCQLAASTRANSVGTAYQTQSCKCSERNSIFLKVMLCPSEIKKKQRKGKQRDYLLQALFKCISFSRLESTVEGCSSQ